MAGFDFDDLETDDRGAVLAFNKGLLELLDSKDVREELRQLRDSCSHRAAFERQRDEQLDKALKLLCKEHGVDVTWVKDRSWALRDDPEIAEQCRRVQELMSFGTIGPLSLARGDCVEVSGLESETGRQLNSRRGVIISFTEGKGRYEVRFSPDNLVQLKPQNVRRLEDGEKLISAMEQALEKLGSLEVQAELDELRHSSLRRERFDRALEERLPILLGPICECHGVELEWVFSCEGDDQASKLRAQLEELMAFCDPGPAGLDRNDCVEVVGLESESGRPNNGKKAVVMRWVPEKGRYEVRLPGGERLLTLKPENVRKLGELERLRCVQKQVVELLAAREAQQALEHHRAKCSNAMQFAKLRDLALPQLIAPACEQHGVDLSWRTEALTANADDPICRAATKRIEELSTFGTLGSLELEKGAFYEVVGLTSEAGLRINGTAVLLRAWDEARGRYDVSPSENLGEVKAMRPENLRAIETPRLGSAEEAAVVQAALREAYEAPTARQTLQQLRAEHPALKAYMAALQPALLELQRPALQRFGFRQDAVGQLTLQRALADFSEDAAVARRSRELEQLLGLQELRFDGRVAIVTGGGRGLGRAYCRLLAARGANVVVNNRTAAKADEVVAEIQAAGGVAVAEHSNVAHAGDKVVQAALWHFGRLDIVVANAGQLEDRRMVNMGLEEFAAVLNTHVVGHFRLLKEAWPHFAKQGYGRVVLIASEAGMHGNFGQLNYSAAKGALLAMGQTLATEGFKDGILVNSICTEGLTRMTNEILPPEQRVPDDELAKALQPAAAPVAYLCHETCKATAGVFRVDNGHVQAYRWQSDEAFVDFDPSVGDAALEDVAERWPEAPKWHKVSYRGEAAHAHGFARSMTF